MGHVRISLTIAHPDRPDQPVRIDDALVDTGATRTVIPRALASQLGLTILGQQEIRTADGVHRIDQSFALLGYDGRQTVGDVWVSDTYPGVLVGVVTLESLGLAVDPASGRLTPSEFLLL